MSYYQACCLLVFSILGTAIIIDPVTHFIFANPCMIAKRFFFALYYMAVTTPAVVIFFTERWPMTAMEFYYDLVQEYKEVFPEVFDKDGNLIEFEEDEDDR